MLKPSFLIYPLRNNGVESKDVPTVTIQWHALSQFVSQLIRLLSQAKVAVPDMWWEYEYPKLKGDTIVGKIEHFEQRKKRQKKY